MVNFKRQIALFDPSQHEDVHVVVIGLGNIGSHTTLALARMGIKQFTLIDYDTVEEHNLSSQAYTSSHSEYGVLKTDALTTLISEIDESISVTRMPFPFLESKCVITADTIVVCAVDSMHTRFAICSMLEESGCMVFDGRMGGGQIELHAQRAKEWRKTLVMVADEDPCSARYISYTSYMIAGVIANAIKRFLQGESYTSRLIMHTDNYDIIKTIC